VPEAVAYAEYELAAVMLTGSCREVARGRPGVSKPRAADGLGPRAAQLAASAATNPAMDLTMPVP
jgi:hypothetical protein